jgi:hypothetical protein
LRELAKPKKRLPELWAAFSLAVFSAPEIGFIRQFVNNDATRYNRFVWEKG